MIPLPHRVQVLVLWEELEQQRLRSFRYEDHVAEIDEWLELAFRFAKPRSTSGLVEQQRLFAKLRKQDTR